MNAGAEHVNGDVLLFLHADTLVPPLAFDAIRAAMAVGGCPGGIFRLQFDHPSLLLRFSAFCTRLPSKRICFGDRGIFASRRVFEDVGGFPPMAIFEDIALVERLVRRGAFEFLDLAVTTSARRYQTQGPWRQQWTNTRLWLQYQLGADPQTLADSYSYD
jgi:GT2 family glycosyltransferase